ncbi:MAG: hypothetical protein QGH94_02870 [Phycisphaerae bacterium]|jgi:hypothetical protein|nr:hypothetical protein [Phycisphaerae bacterium]
MSTELTFSQIEAYAGLKAAAAGGRADILATMKTAGMRGRGGAGFPASVKWNLAAAAVGAEKFIVCNADEGEPGTFKDRLILSDHVDLVFDGMTIAAIAVGASKGILYLRGEYVYLLTDLQGALARRRDDGMLGQNAAGREGFDFDIESDLEAELTYAVKRRRLSSLWKAIEANLAIVLRSRSTPDTSEGPLSSTMLRHWPGRRASSPREPIGSRASARRIPSVLNS